MYLWDEIAHINDHGTVYEGPNNERIFLTGRNGQIHFFFDRESFPLPKESLEEARDQFDASKVLIHVDGPLPTWNGRTVNQTLLFDIEAYLDASAERVPVFDETHACAPVGAAIEDHEYHIYPTPSYPENWNTPL